jgi:hypothetical protein
MKYYKVIQRETRNGINLKVKPANHQHPWGFQELMGQIQSNDIDQAAFVLKTILKDALAQAGFKR